VAGEDGEGAVGLFSEDNAGELVGEGDEAEGEEEVGAGAGGGGPAVGGADGEDEALGSHVAQVTETRGKILGRNLLAAAVEEDEVGTGAAGVEIGCGEEGGLGVEELGVAGEIATGSLEVVGEEAVCGIDFGARASRGDCSEGDLHSIDADRSM
jgi:hypothetical protein